ncbi:winged helix-turn-helix transcriptional regulator [Paenibacillus dauci]|uniref:winged helix-turn-helix transcriptional regulator n=1 Tax=Paenibacillus dauci TaxID=1567106 RepID=UPI000698F3DA|nr:winged-helix domain-containing protein [Paenibacillus dauci]
MQKQIEKVIENDYLSDSTSSMNWAPGNSTYEEMETMIQACPVTRRVVIISPAPSRIHELTRMLSDSCFDVMVFHRWENNGAGAISADLYIFDMITAAGSSEIELAKLRINDNDSHVPSIFLVREEMLALGMKEWTEEELLVWPMRPQEGLYHVERVIRSNASRPAAPAADEDAQHRIVFKDLWIDRKKMTVHRGQQRVELTKTEYDLLLMLIEGEGSVLSREQLMSEIWGTQFFGGSNVVDVHVKSLRKKIGDNASAPQYIATVRGVGYRLAD